MSEQENIRVAEKWIEALTTYDVGQLQNLRAPEYMLEHPGFPGPAGADEEDAHLRRLAEELPAVTVGGGGTTSWVPKSLPIRLLTSDPLFA